MKKLVNSIFPYFDTNALDAARFFFGTTAAEVALYPGRMNLTEFLEEDDFDTERRTAGLVRAPLSRRRPKRHHVPLRRSRHQKVR